MGSLLAALASYLDAKSNNGTWLVRIEDIDPPREQPGADKNILTSLLQHGLQWDEDILYQSTRSEAYNDALAKLKQRDILYFCTCTRALLAGLEGYPGTCRHQTEMPNSAAALRLKCHEQTVHFHDIFQGPHSSKICPSDDMILRRKDGLFAYQLAVVIDDAHQGITHVVRGIDLFDSTARQIYLFQQLQSSAPIYGHIPVVVDNTGSKLSKQNHAKAIDSQTAPANLIQCLVWLNQTLPVKHESLNCEEILNFAIENWQPKKLSGIQSICQ